MLPHVPPFTLLRLLALVLVAALVGCSAGDDAAQDAATARTGTGATADPAPSATGAEPSQADPPEAETEADGETQPAAPEESASTEPTASSARPSAVPTVPARGTPTELEPSEPFGLSSLVLRGPGGREVEVPVYVAASRRERARGLMDRESLPADTGMIFLFPSDSSGAFYMYRTLIPLSIAFFSADGRVVSVLDMEPCPEEEPERCPLYPPGETYRAALEVNQGYLAELGVDEGWTIDLPEDLPAAS